uniref:Uncharacterized protein n=1 Tax=Manihot esculenta TaxID=3983 RepID=A0A2C9VQS0_MANES
MGMYCVNVKNSVSRPKCNSHTKFNSCTTWFYAGDSLQEFYNHLEDSMARATELYLTAIMCLLDLLTKKHYIPSC